MALIKTVNISQAYDGREVLKNVNLEIDRSETFTLIGPTGSGKTTLIRILDLLDSPSSGSLLFDGMDVTGMRANQLEARRRMSYVQQRPLVFTMNVFDNVICGLRWRHVKSTIARKKAEEALELVGMSDYGDRNAKTLSGGETQRVAIARAIVTEPEVLFLDEPTANMDPVSTAKIEEVLGRIINEKKTTVIMTTHNMSQGQRMASRMAVLMDGEIHQIGKPSEIFTSPTSKKVAEFVGVENILTGTVLKKENELTIVAIEGNGNQIQVVSECNVGERVNIIIRPEDVTFALTHEPTSARNNFTGTINCATLVGPLVRIEADCGFPLLGLVTKKSAEELNLTVGRQVFASIKVAAIRTVKAV